MARSNERPWRWIGWDGIRFKVPVDWHPGTIGRRHLFFNNDSGPVLEIKWSPPGSNQQAERIIARLARRHRNAVRIEALPRQWEKALAGRPAAGFAWAGANDQAKGVACRLDGGTWSIVQFFGPQDPRVPATLLASLGNPAERDGRLWSIFDVVARLPPVFGLNRWQFAPGAFRMDFSGAGRSLTLYRFAPASVILKTRDLNDLAAKLLPGASPSIMDSDAGRWFLAGSGPGPWLCRRLGLEPAAQRLRLWHLAEANRILGVWLKGRAITDTDMDMICRAYGCLPLR